jgi:hypothetical protein
MLASSISPSDDGKGGSPENLAHIYKIARRHNAEDNNLTTKSTSALPPKISEIFAHNTDQQILDD